MNIWIKRTLAGAVGIALAGAAALALGSYLGERKAQRHIALDVAPVALPTDGASIERGRYLFATRGCADCHGAGGAGKVFIDGGGMMAKSPNISPGPGSAVAAYRPVDWVRTLRHGVKPNGQPLFIMPSEDYSRLTDADVGALVAYVKQLPPTAGTPAAFRVPAPVKALYAVGLIQDAAEKIDHTLPPAQPVPEGLTAEHGAYVATMCMGCHGPHLSGGKIPGAPPDWPAAANLTPGAGSALARYPGPDAFVAMLRSGRRPDGSAVSRVMPFESLQALNDTDARAVYLFLKSLPPMEAGQR